MKFSKPSSRFTRAITPLVGIAAALALTTGPAAQAASAAPAHRAADEPVPAFDFSDCPPLPPGHARLGSICFNAVVVAGKFVFGKFDQTLTKPIKMTFASAYNPDTFEYTPVFGKLRADKMLVRPGIFGDPILTAVYAKPEYAGVFEPDGFDIKLGMKIRLTNPFLGGTCLIGTDSNPIILNLTTGTTNPPPPNTPITGEDPVLVPGQPVTTRKTTHVENAFAVPGARGCFLDEGIVNAIVDSQAGTPAAAGRNTVIFKEYVGQKRYTQLP